MKFLADLINLDFKSINGTYSWYSPSEPTDIGMRRLALGDEDKSVRDWFVATVQDLGCKVKIDAIGHSPYSILFI